MTRVMLRLFLFIAVTLSLCTQATSEKKVCNVIAMAAADGKGCTKEYLECIHGPNVQVMQIPVVEHSWPMDFGQNQSQWKLYQKIVSCVQPVIYHAVCAGTAAGVYHLVDGKCTDKLAGMVFEGVLASPNAATQFRTSNAIKYPLFWLKPLDYLTATFANTAIGKYVYPQLLLPAGYCAFKESPLEAVSRIENKKLPIVIVEQHADDHAVPPAQSRAMYYKLRELGCNAYFMQPDNASHVDLIDSHGTTVAVIRRIMQGAVTLEDRTLYQPDHLQFECDYTNLIQHDRQVRKVAKVTTATMLCGLLYLVGKVIKR